MIVVAPPPRVDTSRAAEPAWRQGRTLGDQSPTRFSERPSERYQALIHLSEVLSAHQDRASLMRALPIDLPSVLDASFVDLGLYDGTDEPSLPPDIEADQALADYTVHRLQPVVVPVVSLDTRFPRAMGYLRTCGAESVCVLPLAVGERRLGMLVAGSRSPYTYAAFDLEFLMVIARQVAMALDQAGRLDALQRAVTHERDKLNAWRGPTNS